MQDNTDSTLVVWACENSILSQILRRSTADYNEWGPIIGVRIAAAAEHIRLRSPEPCRAVAARTVSLSVERCHQRLGRARIDRP